MVIRESLRRPADPRCRDGQRGNAGCRFGISLSLTATSRLQPAACCQAPCRPATALKKIRVSFRRSFFHFSGLDSV